MRDTYLGLNQKNVLILKNKYIDGKGESLIKTDDLILIRRIQDFVASSKTVQVVINNNIYSWVHYETVQDDLPMIFPSVVSVKKRVEKLKRMGLIVNKTYTVSKEMISKDGEDGFDKAGKFSVIRLSKECRTMFDFSNMETEGQHHEGVKGQHHEGVKGQHHEGVKGQHHEGVKGQHHEGVIKEYHENNTKKINHDHENKHDFIDKFDKLFKTKFIGINYTKTNQESVKKLVKGMGESETIKYLEETYNSIAMNKDVKRPAGLFTEKLREGIRQFNSNNQDLQKIKKSTEVVNLPESNKTALDYKEDYTPIENKIQEKNEILEDKENHNNELMISKANAIKTITSLGFGGMDRITKFGIIAGLKTVEEVDLFLESLK